MFVHNCWHVVSLLLVAACCGCAVAQRANVPVRAGVPADGKIVIADYGCRDWGPELVNYTVDPARFRPGAVALVDGAGAPVPFQIDGATLSFVAAVPKGGIAAYALRSGDSGGAAESKLKSAVHGAVLVVRNEMLSLEMPAPGAKTFAPPAEPSQAAPPILRWAGPDGVWMGGARFVTPRRVAAQTFRLLRQGPAVVEYEARYAFEPKGEYVWRIRLSPGMPLAVVVEEFDFGAITGGEDLLLMDLNRGWRPTSIGCVPGAGEQQMPPLKGVALDAAYIEGKRKAKLAEAPVGGVGQAPAPLVPQQGMLLLEKIFPAGRWGDLKGGVQLWDGEAAQPGPGRNIGLVPLAVGSWRRAMALNVWFQEGTGVSVGLPLSVRHSRWSLETTDDHSPFSTHEHDEGLSRTYGRRVWGLYAGTALQEAQARFGHIGLDRYKDWIIEYPENKATARYPGAFFSPDHVARLRKALDRHPDCAFLKKWYLMSGRKEDAVAHAQRVIEGLKRPYGENDLFVCGLSNYRKSQFLAFTDLAEDALACPDLPAEMRQELRRRLALFAYVMADPDVNPRGSGAHLGNNNMTINRTLALTYFAGLLPDHPMYAYWMDGVRAFAGYKYGTEMAVDGPNIECPSYALYSPFRTLNITQNVLRNRGVHDFGPEGRHAGFLRWLGNLSMPDPRFKGLRIIPGMGNSSNLVENVWGFSMAAEADRDPKFAGWLRFMNRLANGGAPLEKGPNYHDHVNATPHAMYYLPYIPENPQPLATAFMPTYGVAFRHHFNMPNETAMLLRAGMNWGHWDTDALNVILYGKGAPLSPGTGYQYYSGPATEGNAVYHNQVKVGRRDVQEVFGRVDCTVADYGFGPSADYAAARRFYPSQIFGDGGGPMSWNRHVMFLKSAQADGPDYFVMRDTFDGGEARPSWWQWMNLDTADLIAVDGTAFDPAATPLDKNVPEDQFPRLRGQAVEMKTKYGASTWFWFSEPRAVRTRMTFKAAGETKTIVDVPGAPKGDYFYVVYPRKDGQAVPACRALGPGVMSIKTAESTDVVFLADEPFNWEDGGVAFTGKSGAVRVFADRVAFCLNAGSGRVGYNGYVLEGHGPFERVVPLGALRPGVHKVAGGYEKKAVTVDVGKGVQVAGEGPFTASLEGETVRIRTQGRARVLRMTQPPFIVRPQYFIDGRQWMACWTDYPANGWGRYDGTWLIGLSVPEGEHELAVKDLAFPRIWARPFAPLIEGAVREQSPPGASRRGGAA
jgi:hypothetical protein